MAAYGVRSVRHRVDARLRPESYACEHFGLLRHFGFTSGTRRGQYKKARLRASRLAQSLATVCGSVWVSRQQLSQTSVNIWELL